MSGADLCGWTRRRQLSARSYLCALAIVVGVTVGCADEEGRKAGEPPGATSLASTMSTTAVSTTTPVVTAGSRPPSESGAPSSLPAGDDASVVRVVDGDTIVVDGDRTVRFIGVDTPETRHPDLGVQCFGREASAFTASLLPAGTPVRLVYDVERSDRYDRTLAYVYRVDDGMFVNAELVRRGYALVATVPPNVRHAADLVALQRAAREAATGLWSACPDARGISPGSTVDGRCHPAYPSLCLPPPPPDLDCDDVQARRFEVRPPDPHRLDGDGDGIGCAG